MPKDKQNLIWVDLEMTGLIPEEHDIIEIATIVTDTNLNIIEEGPVIAIHQSVEAMNKMDDWNRRTHAKSGLSDRVRRSEIDLREAEAQTLKFLDKLVPNNTSPMCGNSICQDRRFMARHMPRLENFFHYRNLDVSTLKELAKRWAPSIWAGVQKTESHTALSDIRESIEELRHYKQFLLKL